MDKITRCSKCVMPTTLDSISLDEDGVCNNCREYSKVLQRLEKQKDFRIEKLESLIGWAKNKKRPYDCLIPISGGKDSVYCLYLCDKIYNMKCLAITFDNGLLSDYAKNNINEAIKATGADHIYYKVNPDEMMELYALFLKKTGTFCPPCMRGIEIVCQMGAELYDIPLIIKGTGKRYSYLSFVPELFQSGDAVYFKNVIKEEKTKSKTEALLKFTPKWNFSRVVHVGTKLLHLPDPTTPQSIKLFDYVDHSIEDVLKVIKKEMNWKEPSDQVEHMDCEASKISSYLHSIKYQGLSNKTCKNSSLIRLGNMTRKEAIDYEREFSNNVEEPSTLEPFLKKINMSKKDFYKFGTQTGKITKFRNKRKNMLAEIYKKIVWS